MEIQTDRKTYKTLKSLPCCYNCKHSYFRMGIALYCNNRSEWIKEASVELIGICDNFERKERE